MKRLLLAAVILISLSAYTQRVCQQEKHVQPSLSSRIHDSIVASRIPVLTMPVDRLQKSLPFSVDNSKTIYFPDILDQGFNMSCQQFSGVAYTFGYEMNRLRHLNGSLPENRYPAHYTWNFMNDGDRMIGVSFFYSWDELKLQGHANLVDFGPDTANHAMQWMTGYDKYYRAMKNRIKAVYSIPVKTAEGILTLKNYLYDHLDGSATGGAVCFGASSNFTPLNFVWLPYLTPEWGKQAITGFYPEATHGMTIVGYNDSIRYDINGDGYYTNNIDINGDGIVDVKDWEIGAFRIANSYGTWWGDAGYSYVFYRALALNYGNNPDFWDATHGIWNNSVYVLQPDTGYQPKLTLKVNLNHTSRKKIRIRAGVSSDTTLNIPQHFMNFPIFSYQGGDLPMQGLDTIPNNQNIEFGLDVTPLMSYIQPGEMTRLFLIVEEVDSTHSSLGVVNNFSFIDYTNGIHEIPSLQTGIPIRDNDVTFMPVNGIINFNKIQITSDSLRRYHPPSPSVTQLEASGGTLPYQWKLKESYTKKKTSTVFPMVDQQPLYFELDGITYARVILPFHFPFYGTNYDTIYVNSYGFISFDPSQLPYMYLRDEEGMLKRNKTISPAFSINNLLNFGQLGMWMETVPYQVTFRWKLRTAGYDTSLYLNFALRLHSDGRFEFLYGDIPQKDPVFVTYSGISKGDEENFDLMTNWNSSILAHQSFLYEPVAIPEGISLSESGLLTISQADTNSNYEIPVKVTDRNKISAEKSFSLSSGLAIAEEVVSGDDDLFKFGEVAHLKLLLTNNSAEIYRNLQIIISSSDESVIVSDSIISISTLNPGASVQFNSCFSFHLQHPVPDQTMTGFLIQASTPGHHWKKSLNVPVAAFNLVIEKPMIVDGTNGLLDPGEVADVVIDVRNNGSLYTGNISCTLTSEDPLVTILSAPESSVDQIKAGYDNPFRYTIKALKSALPGHLASMKFYLTDQNSVDTNIYFTLKLGKVPVAIVNLSTTSLSPAKMMTALDSLGLPYDYLTAIPTIPEAYSSVFLCLGNDYSGNYALTDNEGIILADYLINHGKLYLESYAMWYHQPKTKVNPYFKYTTRHTSGWYFPVVKGIAETFTDSMQFSYTNTTKYAAFVIEPVAPAYLTFKNSDSISKGLEIVYNGNDYKTIGSLFGFGSLTDGQPPAQKLTLMKRYLNFFDLLLPGPTPFFHCDQTEICRWHTVRFTDDSFDNIVSWQWEFPGGTPSSSTLQNPEVQYIDQGLYNVILTVSDGTHLKSIARKNYISVNACAGIDNLSKEPLFMVFPNPAYDKIRIEILHPEKAELKLVLYDLMGRQLNEKVFKSGTSELSFDIDVSRFPKGIYLLTGTCNWQVYSRKVVVW